MTEFKHAERRKAVMVRATDASHAIRTTPDLPVLDRNLLRDSVSACEREMLPLMQADGLRSYRYGSAEKYGAFRIVTSENDAPTCKFKLRRFRRGPAQDAPVPAPVPVPATPRAEAEHKPVPVPAPAPTPVKARKRRTGPKRAELPDYWGCGAEILAAATNEGECLTLVHGSEGGYGFRSQRTHMARWMCVGQEMKAGVHRIAFGVWHGIPYSELSGLIVSRTCQSPNCVNPLHLDIQTKAEVTARRRAEGGGSKLVASTKE